MNPYDIHALKSALSFAYRLMVASAPLLEFAIPRCEGRLRAYYERHLEEERGHDDMLRGDLAALGVDQIPASHEAARVAGSQYYLIAHDHPALLLGYMRALERDSMTPQQVDHLSAHHRVELTALRHHSVHDPLHLADLDSEITALDPELRARSWWNEVHVAAAIEAAFKETLR